MVYQRRLSDWDDQKVTQWVSEISRENLEKRYLELIAAVKDGKHYIRDSLFPLWSDAHTASQTKYAMLLDLVGASNSREFETMLAKEADECTSEKSAAVLIKEYEEQLYENSFIPLGDYSALSE